MYLASPVVKSGRVLTPIYPSSKLGSVFGFKKKSPFLKPTSIELVTVGYGLTGYMTP